MPVAGGSSSLTSFAYPADGADVLAGSLSASTAFRPGASAAALATSSVSDLSLDGEITADSVSSRVAATATATRPRRARRLASSTCRCSAATWARGSVAVGGWGVLTVGRRLDGAPGPSGVEGLRWRRSPA